jgi:hypothetical protein
MLFPKVKCLEILCAAAIAKWNWESWYSGGRFMLMKRDLYLKLRIWWELFHVFRRHRFVL